MSIAFGTDGWRAVIADGFTYAGLRRVARAHAQVLRDLGTPSVAVGFDTRFQGAAFARVVAGVMAEAGLEVHLAQEYLPTPALSFAVTQLRAGGGVMITASHNPPEYSGYKIKGAYGGSATPELVARVEAAMQAPRAVDAPPGRIHPLDIREAYFRQLDRQLDLPLLRTFRARVVHDPMGGAGSGWLTGYARHAGLTLDLSELHGRPDPLFHGVNPEPVPQNLHDLTELMAADPDLLLGVVTNGDADRVGAVTRGGRFFNSHQIFAVLLRHLYRRGARGRVVYTVSTSQLIGRMAAHYGLDAVETPVGFKYITDAFLEGQHDPARAVLIGGEESGGMATRGHIPERDGLLSSLLLIEALAASGGRDLAGVFRDIEQEVGLNHAYRRTDLHLGAGAQKGDLLRRMAALNSLGGRRVVGVNTTDGVKLLLDGNATVMFRASGTEPLLRVYIEGQSEDEVEGLWAAARETVRA